MVYFLTLTLCVIIVCMLIFKSKERDYFRYSVGVFFALPILNHGEIVPDSTFQYFAIQAMFAWLCTFFVKGMRLTISNIALAFCIGSLAILNSLTAISFIFGVFGIWYYTPIALTLFVLSAGIIMLGGMIGGSGCENIRISCYGKDSSQRNKHDPYASKEG